MREREAKLVVPDSFELPDMSDAIDGASLGAVEERLIEDVYYDTPGLRLLRWGCTLRYRSGDGWVVKIPRPSKGLVLDRDEAMFGGDPGEPPMRALNLVSPLTRGAPVVQVARLKTKRRARRWFTDGESAGGGHADSENNDSVAPSCLAELTDDDVRGTTSGGDRVQFREIEVELMPDVDGQLLDGVVERLWSAAPTAEPPAPKLARVLGDMATQPPDVEVAALPSKPTARQVIQVAFATSVDRLLRHLPAARLGVDPRGVHQARVASRRMRSDLQTFGPLLDADWSAELQADLKTLIDVLGAVRDSDVLGAKLLDVAARHPDIDPTAAGSVVHEVNADRRRARRRLLRFLGQERTLQLLDRLIAAADDPPTLPRAERSAKKVLPKLVRKRWKRLNRAVRALGPDPSPRELHRIRILSKRVRYATEAVAPAAGKQATRFAIEAARIQDALGELNDAAVAQDRLGDIANSLDGRAAFTAGQLAQQLTVEARIEGENWRRAHRKMKRRTAWFS
jgi:CHAD domain-containing protein